MEMSTPIASLANQICALQNRAESGMGKPPVLEPWYRNTVLNYIIVKHCNIALDGSL